MSFKVGIKCRNRWRKTEGSSFDRESRCGKCRRATILSVAHKRGVKEMSIDLISVIISSFNRLRADFEGNDDNWFNPICCCFDRTI